MDSRDVIISMALEFDLSTLFNYCRTSKRINNLVCDNNLFWVLKLKKNFDISLEDIEVFKETSKNKYIKNIAKSYYEDISNTIQNYSDVNELYSHAIHNGRLDLVKIALQRGANINHIDHNRTPLTNAIIFNHPSVANYLLEHGIIATENDFIYNVSQMTKFINEDFRLNERQQEAIFSFIYDKIFPRMYHLLPRKKYKKFWKTTIAKLEEFQDRLPYLYERRINELKTLI